MVVKDIFNPFPGLRAFEEDEDYLFFGREKQIDDLLEKLRTNRFIAVVGASGSGKSSLVKCGVLPSLYSGYMAKAGSGWKVGVMRPGDNPIVNLAKTLAKPGLIYETLELEDATYTSIVEATLRRSSLGLIEAVKQSAWNTSDNLLIVVDQFEELFRFNKYEKNERGERRDSVSFVDLLLNAARQSEVSIYIVLTMRSDFIGECTVFSGLAEAINRSQYLVPRMSRDERREAIAGPIAVGGATITPRFLTHLLNDVGDTPDQLPILQHAMLRTWLYWKENHQENEPLDLSHYLAIGTMAEALSQHAEEAYHELKSDSEKKIAELVFKTITEKGEERQGIRRPTRLGEICNVCGSPLQDVIAVIDTFRKEGRSFLMPPPELILTEDSIIDIAHESLMRIWTRLIKWVEEETQSADIYKRLAQDAALYHEARSGLWRNPELQFAIKWHEENKPNRYWAQRYDPSFERAIGFLKESKRQEEFESLQKERQEKLKIKRIRLSAVILGTAAFVCLLLLIVTLNLRTAATQNADLAQKKAKEAEAERRKAENEKQIAERQRTEADSLRRQAERQKRKLEIQTGLALQFAHEADSQKTVAVRAQGTAQEALKDAETQRRNAETEKTKADTLRERAVASEKRMDRLRMLSLSTALAFQSIREHRNNNIELSTLLARHAYRFNLDNGGVALNPEIYQALALVADERLVYAGHADAVRAVRISKDGKKILTGSNDKTVRIWDTGNPHKSPLIFAGGEYAIRSVAYSNDSRYVIAGNLKGEVIVWGFANTVQGAPRTIDLQHGSISALASDYRSSAVIAGCMDGAVFIVKLSDAAITPQLFTKVPGKITDMAIEPDGYFLAVAYGEDAIAIYDLRSSQAKPVMLSLKNSKMTTVSFSHDGNYMATGGRDGKVFIWEMGTQPKVFSTLTGHSSNITGLAFSPDDHLLATAGLDKTVRLWSYKTPEQEPVILNGHTGWVWSLAFTQDGNTLISGSEDRMLRSWTPSLKFLMKRACEKVTRTLTPQEWNNSIGNNVNYEDPCK